MRRLARNWDLVLASAAFATVLSCVVGPHARRVLGDGDKDTPAGS